MTTITIYTDNNKDAVGFTVTGHAMFRQQGKDIVCAAISMLTINACNSIETFTNDFFGIEEDEKSGYLEFVLNENPSKEAKLLLNSMVLGLSELEKQYKNKYLKLIFEEV